RAAAVAGVGRVDAQVVIVGAARRLAVVGGAARTLIVGDARSRRVAHAVRDVVEIVVRRIIEGGAAVVAVVAVAVPVGGDGDEVSVRADRLVDAAVILALVKAAGAAELFVILVRSGDPGAGAERPELAGVDHREGTEIVEASDRALELDSELVGG